MSARILLAAVLLAVVASGCKGRSAEETAVSEPAAAPSWTAYKNGQPVLRFRKGPGTLRSSALPGADGAPSHPWLDAQALDPLAEDDLRKTLEASSSFDDFVARLKAAGYDVRREAPP